MCMDTGGDEEELYRFGPVGISVSFSPPDPVSWTRQDSTEVVLTSRRIYGVGTLPGPFGVLGRRTKPVFDLSLPGILAVEPVRSIAGRAVRIRYWTTDGEKELTLVESALRRGRLSRLVQLLGPLVRENRGG